MKVIQIIPTFGLGGAERMCENMCYELTKAGCEVVVISLYNYHSAITDRLEKSGIRIIYLGKKRGLDFSVISKLRKCFHIEKPDIVHTHLGVLHYVVPAASGWPTAKIHTLHSIASRENKWYARKLNYLFYRFNKVVPVAISDVVRQTAMKEYRLKENKIPIICNGIDLSKCIPKRDYAISQKAKILHIGSLSLPKNHTEMIKAIKLLKEKQFIVELILIGDGPLREDVLETIEALKLQDVVIWKKTTDNVYPYLNESDVFILPSIYEGFPMSLLEAMGTGLPIVASNVGGIPDMITDGEEGLLCDPSADSIAEKIECMLESQQLRKNCGEAALKKVKCFSSEIMAEKYIELYSNIKAGKKNGRQLYSK